MSLLSWLFGAWGCAHCARMHRRAQAAESEAIATPRRFEGTLRDMMRRLHSQQRLRFLWRNRYRTVVCLLEDRGMPRSEIREAVLATESLRREGLRTTSPSPEKP